MSDSPFVITCDASNFQQVVIDGSEEQPVLVDFWADWCQPCRILMPILAQLAQDYAGKFILAKVNTEEQQDLAAMFGIRSLPTVKLFKNGQPVDEFMGALPEAQIREFLDKHIPRESDKFIQLAKAQLAEQKIAEATTTLQQAREVDPNNPEITLALCQLLADQDQAVQALELLDSLPASEQDKDAAKKLRGQLHFRALAAQAAPPSELEARLALDENDSEARFQLAGQKVAAGDFASALDMLLVLLRKDRKYGDDAARKSLLQIFDLLGDDPLVARYRNKMFNLLH